MNAQLLATASLVAHMALCASFAAAQGREVPIRGSVRDIYTRDGYIAGATVKVTEHRTGATVTLVTGADGTFVVEAARPGVYTIEVSAPGYGTLIARNFCVVEGEPASLPVGLGPDRGARPGQPPPSALGVESLPVLRPVSVPDAGTLTPKEIEQAIALGRKTRIIEPPRLAANTVVVLPPSWRVASMTQIADGLGTPFKPGEIPAPFIEKLAWITAPPWPTRNIYRSETGDAEFLAPVTDIVIRPKGARDARSDVRPAWTVGLNTPCDVSMFADVLGHWFSRPSLLAAFPAAALKPGDTIVITYSTRAMPLDVYRWIAVPKSERRVVIRQKDVDTWK